MIINCSLILHFAGGSSSYLEDTSLCALNTSLIERPDTETFPVVSILDSTNLWLLASRISMTVGTNASISDLRRAMEMFAKFKPKFNGSEWGTRSGASDTIQFTVAQSLCVSSSANKYADISVKRRTGFPEPDIPLVRTEGSILYNTSAVEQQLQSQTPKQHRGVFELPGWTELANASFPSKVPGPTTWLLSMNGFAEQLCDTIPCSTTISALVGAIFFNTLDDTNDLSQALQSILTTMTITQYNSQFAGFDASYNATITRTRIYPMPRKVLR